MKTLILTDLEPDDLVFIMAYFYYYDVTKEFTDIIVGEGNEEYIKKKVQLLMELIPGIISCLIFLGEPSNQKFEYEMKDYEYKNMKLPSYKKIMDKTMKYDRIICIKPPRELFQFQFQFWKQHGVKTNVFEGIELYIYGSYNFRCLFEKNYVTFSRMTILLNCFKKVHLVDKFLNDKTTYSANVETTPQIYRLLKESGIFMDYCRSWNEFKLAEITSITTSNAEDIKRFDLIKKSIIQHQEFQFVMADPLILFVLEGLVHSIPFKYEWDKTKMVVEVIENQ